MDIFPLRERRACFLGYFFYRDLVRRRGALPVTFGILLIAAAFAALLFATSADLASVRSLSPRGIAALVYLAIPGLGLGQWFWQEGMARLGRRAPLYLSTEPCTVRVLRMNTRALGRPELQASLRDHPR